MTVQKIFQADPNGAELVTFAKSTAERLVKDGLTRAQIRNIFTEVRKIEALWSSNQQAALRRLVMLKPKLDYIKARDKSVTHLAEVLGDAITQVNDAPAEKRQEYFQRFMELFEAILAYHRAQVGGN